MKELFTAEWFWCFTVLSFFAFLANEAGGKFRGSSNGFRMLTTIVGGIGFIAVIVFLIMAGIKYMWWYPIIMFIVASIAIGVLGKLIASLFPAFILGILASIGVIVLGIMTYQLI